MLLRRLPCPIQSVYARLPDAQAQQQIKQPNGQIKPRRKAANSYVVAGWPELPGGPISTMSGSLEKNGTKG